MQTKTGKKPPMISPRRKASTPSPGLVTVLAYDGLCTFEFGIAVEVFGLPRPEFDFPWYEFAVVAAERRRSKAMGGIVVEASANLAALDRAKTVIVPGWRDRTERPPDADLAGPLGDRRQHDVHDADAADEKRNPGDESEHKVPGELALLGVLEKLVWHDHRNIGRVGVT